MNLLLLAPLLALIFSLAWFGFLGRPRFLRSASSQRVLEGGEGEGLEEFGGLSVIIPARNEAGRIGTLLESLRSEQDLDLDYEVIVVDDQSGDETADLARKFGARVIQARDLPDGWKGKPWACFQGAEMAKFSWLLFLDADLKLEQGALLRLANLVQSCQGNSAGESSAQQQRKRVISLCPYHRLGSVRENFSAFFNLLMVAGTGCFGWHRPEFERLFGQSLLIEKELYRRIGGHELVRDEVLENFTLSAHLAKAGVETRSFLGKGVLSMRMYSADLGEIAAGWRKSFVQGARGSSKMVLILSSCWISSMMVAIGSLSLLFWGDVGLGRWLVVGLYLWLAGICWVSLRWVGSYGVWVALLWPIPLFFYQWVFFSALLGQKQGKVESWKGREV